MVSHAHRHAFVRGDSARFMPSPRRSRPGYGLVVLCLAVAWGLARGGLAANSEAYRLNESAVALTAQGRYEEAAALLDRALRLDPGDAAIRRNLAGVRTVWGHRLMRDGTLERAEEQYRAALALQPTEVSALLGLGDVQLRGRNPRSAIETYRRVIGLDARNPDGYARLGEAYVHVGELGLALAEWERALAFRPDDEWLRRRVEEVRREAKVQRGYRARDSQHFTVVFEGESRDEIGRAVLQILEAAYSDVGYELGAYPPYEIQTIIYTDADFRAATGLPSGAGAFYHRLDGKIRVAQRGLTPGDARLTSVLYHEYTHALVYAITRGKTPPRWFDEGLSVHMERGRASEFRKEALSQARAGVVPPLEVSPYVHGSVAVEYLIQRFGMTGIRHLLQRLGEGIPFAAAFRDNFRTDLPAFEQELREVLARQQ